MLAQYFPDAPFAVHAAQSCVVGAWPEYFYDTSNERLAKHVRVGGPVCCPSVGIATPTPSLAG